MSRRAPKRKKPKPPKPPNPGMKVPTLPPRAPAKRGTTIWTIVSGSATVLAFLVLWPRVNISVSNPIDPENVFSASFVISNTGLVQMNHTNVSIYCGFMKMFGGGANITNTTDHPETAGENGLHFEPPDWQDHSIAPDISITVSPESQIVGWKVPEADILLVISYRPWSLPFRLKKKSRWVAIPDGSGRVYWRSWPANEKAPTY